MEISISVVDLIHCTNEMNVNIPQLADSLFERTTNTSWVVVFKSLITTHHLMVYGNEVRNRGRPVHILIKKIVPCAYKDLQIILCIKPFFYYFGYSDLFSTWPPGTHYLTSVISWTNVAYKVQYWTISHLFQALQRFHFSFVLIFGCIILIVVN